MLCPGSGLGPSLHEIPFQLFSAEKKLACMNRREVVQEVVELVRRIPLAYDQSPTEQKEAVLLADIWERVAEEFNSLIRSKPMFPSLCCTYLFSVVVEQAAEIKSFSS